MVIKWSARLYILMIGFVSFVYGNVGNSSNSNKTMKSAGGQVHLIADVTMKPEFADRFEKEFLKVRPAVLNEKGNKRYEGFRSKENPQRFYFVETFTDKEAFVAHQKAEHFQTFFKTIEKWIEKGPTLIEVTPLQ